MSDLNQLYAVHKNPWGTKPAAEIAAFTTELRPGSILDIGVGDGRNILFLAKEGFEITGLDIAPEAIFAFKQTASAEELRAKGITADISEYHLTEQYDNIFSHYTLHFLSKEIFLSVIKKIQAATAPGGINLITDFTQDGPLYKPTTSHYWLKNNELPSLYNGWKIVSYAEKSVITRAKDENGHPYKQMAATLVARKPD